MVTHCICHDISLARLREIAAAERLELDALKQRTGCCTGCGLCEPYVRLMLRTGQTSFRVLSPAECTRVMHPPAPETDRAARS